MKKFVHAVGFFLIPVLFTSCLILDPYSERSGHDRFSFVVEGGTSYHEASHAQIASYITYVYGGMNSTRDTLYVAADLAGASRGYSIVSAAFSIPVSNIVVGKDVPIQSPENMILNVVYNRKKIALRAKSGTILFESFDMLQENGGAKGQNIKSRASFDVSFFLEIPGEEGAVLHLTKGVFDIENPSSMSNFYQSQSQDE